MFRLPPHVDPAEEKKRVQADVRHNLIIFASLCIMIRLAPFLLQKVNS